jgi:hypothetical protein
MKSSHYKTRRALLVVLPALIPAVFLSAVLAAVNYRDNGCVLQVKNPQPNEWDFQCLSDGCGSDCLLDFNFSAVWCDGCNFGEGCEGTWDKTTDTGVCADNPLPCAGASLDSGNSRGLQEGVPHGFPSV